MTFPKLTILYDGECPFCRNFVAMYRIRETAGNVELINVRDHMAWVQDLRKRGLEINDGMVAIWDGRYYYGPDSVALLTMLSANGGLFAWMNRKMFGNPQTAAKVYPYLVKGRKLALLLLGRKLIA